MADAHNNQPRQPREVLQQCFDACEKDDPALLDEAISIASSTPGFRFSKQDMVHRSLQRCIGLRAPKVLTYLLEQQDVDVNTVYPNSIFALQKPEARPLLPFLEILLAHGWDIDTHGPKRTDWPLLWYALGDPELLEWCLQQGANVYIPGDTPPRKNGVREVQRIPLLEQAAREATVETFEKLRAKGAPLGPRTLLQAVYGAALRAPKDGDEDKASYKQSMALVRHLIDVVGLDVNADGGYLFQPWGTPLYLLADQKDGRDTRGLIWLLLDRGADPDLEGGANVAPGVREPPLHLAQRIGNTRFTDAVEEWKARQADRST